MHNAAMVAHRNFSVPKNCERENRLVSSRFVSR